MDSNHDWQAGAASAAITPEEPMYPGGYGSRNRVVSATEQELFADALALEDGAGTRVVLVGTDLLGITRELRDAVVAACPNLAPESIVLNASHTHCGPELLQDDVPLTFSLDGASAEDCEKQVERYVPWAAGRIADAIDGALDDLAPARVGYSHARAGFGMNRRTPVEGSKGSEGPVNTSTEGTFKNHPNPEGPVDTRVPVLRVDSPDGDLRAVAFGYACHATTCNFYRWCGDWPGYAKEYVEDEHPGATAVFLAGCGGDINPYPRWQSPPAADRPDRPRQLVLAEQHGRTLANAVETALLADPRPVTGPLATALDSVSVDFDRVPDRAELEKRLDADGRRTRRRARHLLDQRASEGALPTAVSMPVGTVSFGDDLAMALLPGEPVVDYALRITDELDATTWTIGYCNADLGYVPSARVRQEGGYEGTEWVEHSVFPGPFSPAVEDRIVSRIRELAGQPP